MQTRHERRVAHLYGLLARWTAEYPAILAIDRERARHHFEGILDLQSLIRRLETTDATRCWVQAIADEGQNDCGRIEG